MADHLVSRLGSQNGRFDYQFDYNFQMDFLSSVVNCFFYFLVLCVANSMLDLAVEYLVDWLLSLLSASGPKLKKPTSWSSLFENNPNSNPLWS